MTIVLAHHELVVDKRTGQGQYELPVGVRGSIDLRTEAQCGVPDNALNDRTEVLAEGRAY